MGYCRTCHAQLKGAFVCKVCGTERIRPKKRLKHMAEHPDGAAALRMGIRENRRLILIIVLCLSVSSLIPLWLSVRALPKEGLLPLPTAMASLAGLLFPVGLLLLLRESSKKAAFSPLGFRLAAVGIATSVIPVLAWLATPVNEEIGSMLSILWFLFIEGFEFGFSFLLLLPDLALFGGLFWWVGYGAVLCNRFSRLAVHNKRFRISRIFRFGLLVYGVLSFYTAYTKIDSPASFVSSIAAGACSLMFFSLLLKVNKHL